MTYTEPMDGYLSARGRATAITVLVIVELVIGVLATAAWATAGNHVGEDLSSSLGAFASASAMDSFGGLISLATTIVFLTWVYRSIANLSPLGSMNSAFTPSGAVWSFFIPFINLVRPHQVMATIWRESQPPAVNENGLYLPRKTTLVHWWWGLVLFGIVAAVSTISFAPLSVERLRSLASEQVVLHMLRLPTGILFLLMIRGAQKRQDEMWQDLERRRNVPKPTAEALR